MGRRALSWIKKDRDDRVRCEESGKQSPETKKAELDADVFCATCNADRRRWRLKKETVQQVNKGESTTWEFLESDARQVIDSVRDGVQWSVCPGLSQSTAPQGVEWFADSWHPKVANGLPSPHVPAL